MTIRIPGTPTRRSGPASMDTMRYGAFSPEDLPYVWNVEEFTPEDLGACDASVIFSLGGLGECDGCEQSTEESKLAINSWRNGKEGVQIILIRG